MDARSLSNCRNRQIPVTAFFPATPPPPTVSLQLPVTIRHGSPQTRWLPTRRSTVTAAACLYGRALGAHHALLNSATHIYDRLGFEPLGLGQSWWMHDSMTAAPPPTPDQVRFVEALGRGRLAELTALSPSALPEDLNARLPCGMTPMGVAVAIRQERSIRWLMRLSVLPTLVQCWDLDWRASVESQLAANPQLVNELSVNGLRTPLHHAIERIDHDLFHLLLKANPDLTVLDKEYNGTPLGWAHHLGRAELIRELQGRLSAQAPNLPKS